MRRGAGSATPRKRRGTARWCERAHSQRPQRPSSKEALILLSGWVVADHWCGGEESRSVSTGSSSARARGRGRGKGTDVPNDDDGHLRDDDAVYPACVHESKVQRARSDGAPPARGRDVGITVEVLVVVVVVKEQGSWSRPPDTPYPKLHVIRQLVSRPADWWSSRPLSPLGSKAISRGEWPISAQWPLADGKQAA